MTKQYSLPVSHHPWFCTLIIIIVGWNVKSHTVAKITFEMFNLFGYQGSFIEAISNLIPVLKEQTEPEYTDTGYYSIFNSIRWYLHRNVFVYNMCAFVLHLVARWRFTCSLNSSPIDELGEGAYEGGWWCQAKCEHRAGHAGIHCNPESGNHPPGTVTLINSVEILTNLYTYHGQPRGREGKGQTAAQMLKYELEIAWLPERVHII